MGTDYMHYDVMVLQALRGVVRQALKQAAETGLPGDHHFYITFRTSDEGVEIPDRVREQHSQELTIVVQHRFWNLKVEQDAFEVDLSFNNIREHLRIPIDSIINFVDPSVNFVLPFELQQAPVEPVEAFERPDNAKRQEGRPADSGKDDETADDTPKESADVVSFEAFRKK